MYIRISAQYVSTRTDTRAYIYIYVYIYVCVCVCISGLLSYSDESMNETIHVQIYMYMAIYKHHIINREYRAGWRFQTQAPTLSAAATISGAPSIQWRA